MNKKLLLLIIFAPHHLLPDPTCTWETTTPDLDTNVSQNGPLRFVGCSCNCAQYRWHQGTICHVCNHAHAGALTTGNKQFTFQWLPGLMAYNEKKSEKQSTKPKPELDYYSRLEAYQEADNAAFSGSVSSAGSGGGGGGAFMDEESGGSLSGGDADPLDSTDYSATVSDYYQGQSTTSQAFDGPSVGAGIDNESSSFDIRI